MHTYIGPCRFQIISIIKLKQLQVSLNLHVKLTEFYFYCRTQNIAYSYLLNMEMPKDMPPTGYPPAEYPPAEYPPAGYPPAGYPQSGSYKLIKICIYI